jgi:hypothetical protein
MAGRADVNPTQGFGATERQRRWDIEEPYWRDNWHTRPYASSDRTFDYYRPAYQYGVDSAERYSGKQWADVERDIEVGWGRFEHRTTHLWEDVRHAVRDAFDRVTVTK